MAHSRPVSPLLLHHQDSGPPVHEGQGAVQHVQDPDSLQPAADAPQRLDLAQNCQLLAHRQIQLALSACGLLRWDFYWAFQPFKIILLDSYDALYALDMTWWYFFSKFIDYFDSVFFLLRKKWSHLSTLHVIHHGIMPLTAWSGVK